MSEEWDAEAAFEGGGLSTSQVSRTALEPGAVVAGEENERVVEEVLLAERLNDLAYAPVDLLDGVTEVTEAGFTTKTF